MTVKSTSRGIPNVYSLLGTLPGLFFDPDGGDGAGAGVVDVEVGADAPEASAEGAAEAGAPDTSTPSWTPDSPEFHSAVDQRLNERLDQLVREAEWEAQQQQGQGEQPGFEFDPFGDNPGEQIANLIGGLLDEKLGQALAPLNPIVEETQNAWAQQQVAQMFDSFSDLEGFGLKGTDGVPLEGEALQAAHENRQHAERMAAGFMAGLPENAPPWARQQAIHQALRQGAETVKQIRDSAFKAGEAAYIARLQASTGTQQDAPVNGGGLQRQEGGSYDDIILRHQRTAEAREASLRGTNSL
jgi:hypothetical protein